MVNSRRKGIVGELEAVGLWRRWFPTCRRGVGQHRDGGELPDLVGVDRFFVEVKRHRAPTGLDLRDFWRELVKDWAIYEKAHSAEVGLWPVLMWRRDGNRKAWRIAMHDETAKDLGVAPQWGDWTIFRSESVVTMSWYKFRAAMDRIYPFGRSLEIEIREIGKE